MRLKRLTVGAVALAGAALALTPGMSSAVFVGPQGTDNRAIPATSTSLRS